MLNPDDPLVQLAIRLLSFSPQSADAERLFSVYTDTKTKKRTRLKLAKLNQTIFLKTELRAEQSREGLTRKRLKRQFGNPHRHPTASNSNFSVPSSSEQPTPDVIELDDSDDDRGPDTNMTNDSESSRVVGLLNDEDVAMAIENGDYEDSENEDSDSDDENLGQAEDGAEDSAANTRSSQIDQVFNRLENDALADDSDEDWDEPEVPATTLKSGITVSFLFIIFWRLLHIADTF